MKQFDLAPDTKMSPLIGLLHAMVTYNFDRLKKLVEGLTQAEIDYKGPNDELNSIAQLIRHLAVVDLHWVYRLQSAELPANLREWYGPMYDQDGKLPMIMNISMSTLLEEYEHIQDMLGESCRKLNDEDLLKVVSFENENYSTIRWGIWHVADHSRHHYANIAHMKKLVKIETIRAAEKRYHDSCYDNHKLFEPGSWLHKPVKTVIDLLEQFENQDNLRVLDLGSGIGRNSIPIAEFMKNRNGKVICVDVLQSAIENLVANSKEFRVEPHIETRLSDIEIFPIEPGEYDLIIAVSALEHISSVQALERKLKEMVTGTKSNGVNCIIIGSNIREVTIETNIELEPMFEVNIATELMMELLDHVYDGWEIQFHFSKPLEYEIGRNDQRVKLKMDCITFVAKNI